MSVSRAWYIRCDDCGDPAEISTDSAQEALIYANNQGFIRVERGGKAVDLCPRHAEGWGGPIEIPEPMPVEGAMVSIRDLRVQAEEQ